MIMRTWIQQLPLQGSIALKALFMINSLENVCDILSDLNLNFKVITTVVKEV